MHVHYHKSDYFMLNIFKWVIKISKFKIGDVKSSMLQDKVGKALNELEDYSSIIGKDSFNRDLVEKILEADVSEIEGKVMSLTNIMSSKNKKSYNNHIKLYKKQI